MHDNIAGGQGPTIALYNGSLLFPHCKGRNGDVRDCQHRQDLQVSRLKLLALSLTHAH